MMWIFGMKAPKREEGDLAKKEKGLGKSGRKEGYDAASRLAEQGMNVEGIREKVNLPRNEIELIVKFKRMNMSRSNRDVQGRHRDYSLRRLEALRSASEKIARRGVKSS
jgi:hypothetical protein